ncbi:MAG: hypothetical protein ACJ789_10260 [Thermomicrobiales bacterium]
MGSESSPSNQSGREPRFRILAGEAHSWSALLLEDDQSQRYLYLVADGMLEPIVADFATLLLEGREFRPWRGRQDLQPLSALPIFAETSRTPSWLAQADVHVELVLEDEPDTLLPA